MNTPRCADCGIPISDPRVQRCGPHGQQELARRRKTEGYCADCGRRISGGDGRRCNSCEQKRRRERRRDDPTAFTLSICPLDGLAVKHHPKCAICTALTGAPHMQQYAGVTAAGVPFCTACEPTVRRFDARTNRTTGAA